MSADTAASEEPIAEARRLLADRTPGKWYVEPERSAVAGVTPEIFGPDRCVYCEDDNPPIWVGRTDINGRQMKAHVHTREGGYDTGGHRIYSWPDYPGPTEATVCGNFDYEQGGVLSRADARLIAAAPRLLEALCDEVERLRSLAAGLEERLDLAEEDADQLARALQIVSGYIDRAVWEEDGFASILAEHAEALKERKR